ncbi:MAG: histidine kinase [Candidatus Omnitrophica bacterium]|nr:histidine kinase [Candidatus Omnitrophota bacterium]
MTSMHRLLLRQLKKFSPFGEEIPEEWMPLFKAINQAYNASDEDRRLMEKSMDISSREMSQAYKDLSRREAELREALEQLRRTNQELQETQEQLIQNEKLASIGQLAAGVAHEINNPLSFVTSNIQMLERYLATYGRVLEYSRDLDNVDPNDKEKVRSFVSGMRALQEEVQLEVIMGDITDVLGETKDGLDRVKNIVNDLRTFAREDRGELTMTRLDEIIDRSLAIAANEVKYKAEVVKEYADDLPLVPCSEQRLGQVFINLIVNAAQALDEQGTITVRTYHSKGFVCAEVSDTGKGISPENMRKIFDPFFTTKPPGFGTGLGLSVCHEIIKNHQGEISVRSEPNKGTTFLIQLPVHTAREASCGGEIEGSA